jgi:hypothetical protein
MKIEQTRNCVSWFISASLLFYANTAVALFEEDSRISGDNDIVNLDVDRQALNEVRDLLTQGYPVQSVYLHGVGRGNSIDDMVFLATRAEPQNAARYADIAIEMLPALPGWACRSGGQSAENRYAPEYQSNALPSVASLQNIADRFFEDNQRISPFPNWSGNEVHVDVPIAELKSLLGSDYWYSNGRADRPVNTGVMVSLYQHDKKIIVDGNLGQIEKAIQNGQSKMSVIVVYNEDDQRPISEFGDDVTTPDIVDAYFSERLEVTLVPNWQGPYGDFHHQSPIDDLQQYIELPDRGDISDERWQTISTELKSVGFNDKPVLISLYDNDRKVWIDQPDRLTAARELGIENVPVVYLYHSIDRLACGVEPGSDCEDRIRKAADVGGNIQSTQNHESLSSDIKVDS